MSLLTQVQECPFPAAFMSASQNYYLGERVGMMSGKSPSVISAGEQHTFASANALEGISKLTWHGISKAAHVSPASHSQMQATVHIATRQ